MQWWQYYLCLRFAIVMYLSAVIGPVRQPIAIRPDPSRLRFCDHSRSIAMSGKESQLIASEFPTGGDRD